MFNVRVAFLASFLFAITPRALTGLDVHDWGNHDLIRSDNKISYLRRIWAVVVGGEIPSVEPAAFRRDLKPAFAEKIGTFRITRFESIRNSLPAPSPR